MDEGHGIPQRCSGHRNLAKRCCCYVEGGEYAMTPEAAQDLYGHHVYEGIQARLEKYDRGPRASLVDAERSKNASEHVRCERAPSGSRVAAASEGS